MATAKEFQTYCNSLDSGHLKEWKAHSMLVVMHDIPDIISDSVSRLTYLTKCLEMEGFSRVAIEKINIWVIDNV